MSAISAVQCRFLAGAKVSAARKTVRARAAAVAPVAKFGCVRGKSMPLATLAAFSSPRARIGGADRTAPGAHDVRAPRESPRTVHPICVPFESASFERASRLLRAARASLRASWLTVFPASRVSRFFPSSSKVELPKAVKPAVIAAVTNALVAMPSMAGEPGKIFDFNLTLPIIATEFLLLMVILDKTIFGPVGKALDDRDALIRDQLAAVGDNSTAVADLIVSTRERPPRRSPRTRRVFGGRTNAPGAPRAFPARPTARDRRASPPDTWRLTGAREPPIGVVSARAESIDRVERIAVSTIRCFLFKLRER